MNDEGNKLLENLMSALGDNPQEAIGQMLSAFSDNVNEQAEIQENSEKKEEKFDTSLLLGLQSLVGSDGQPDKRSALLMALRPFLSETRQPMLDQALKLLKLSKFAQTAKELDFLKNLL